MSRYEPAYRSDGDPEKGILGSAGDEGPNSTSNYATVFLESVRDAFSENIKINPKFTIERYQSVVAAHELGHQFLGEIVVGQDSVHRDNPPNLMSKGSIVSEMDPDKIFFDSREVARLRSRRKSPGQ